MNVALNVIEFNNEIAALSTGYQASWLGTTDLSAKFTANALGKVANQLEQPAEKFHQRIDDIVRKSTKELSQQRAVTRRQQEQLFASRLSISMFGNIIYSGIFEMLVEPVAEGKHL
jgi:gamma-glutamyl:cysteine ligase YbdK (ATP-grasp superfamily)